MRKLMFAVILVMGLSAGASAAEPSTANQMQEAFSSTTTVVLHSIVFAPGRATVTPGSRLILDEIKKLMDLESDLKLSIEVHTDSRGKSSSNLELSKRQAMALKEALIKRGVDAKRLFWQGYGDEKPLDTNSTVKGRAKNRRVELVKK